MKYFNAAAINSCGTFTFSKKVLDFKCSVTKPKYRLLYIAFDGLIKFKEENELYFRYSSEASKSGFLFAMIIQEFLYGHQWILINRGTEIPYSEAIHQLYSAKQKTAIKISRIHRKTYPPGLFLSKRNSEMAFYEFCKKSGITFFTQHNLMTAPA